MAIRSRKGLSPARVVQESLAIVDAGGPDALTMRAVAQRLDVVPMALYNHFKDRDAILDAIADRVFAQLPRTTTAGRKPVRSQNQWKRHLRDILMNARDLAAQHPHVYRLAMTRPNKPPSAFQLTSEALALLRHAGLTTKQSLAAYHTLAMLLQGFPFWLEGYERQAQAGSFVACNGESACDGQFRDIVEWLINAVAATAERNTSRRAQRAAIVE